MNNLPFRLMAVFIHRPAYSCAGMKTIHRKICIAFMNGPFADQTPVLSKNNLIVFFVI